MSDIQFFQTRMGRQYYEEIMPELIRQLHRLNDLLALAVEMIEVTKLGTPPDKEDGNEKES